MFNKNVDPLENLRETEEIRLREIIMRLKSTRSSIQSTIFHELETHHPEHDLKPNESKTAELELAVLVQVIFFQKSNSRIIHGLSDPQTWID